MSVGRAVGVTQRLVATVVLALSGFYLLVYLYRWEWNRAIVAGIFFVAAEVGLATSMVLRRIRVVEGAINHPAGPTDATLDRLRRTPVDRPDPFRWMTPRSGNLSVFVPVLLGAGAILSAMAYLVERVAEATAVPVLDRRLARRLAVLAPPPNGVLQRHATPPAAPKAPAARRAARATASAVVLVGVGILGWLAVSALMDATQSRPDRFAPAATTIELAIAERGTDSPVEVTVGALWVGCRSSLGRDEVPEARIVPLGEDRALLVVEPGFGRLQLRRLTGCLTDFTLDRLHADVVAVTSR